MFRELSMSSAFNGDPETIDVLEERLSQLSVTNGFSAKSCVRDEYASLRLDFADGRLENVESLRSKLASSFESLLAQRTRYTYSASLSSPALHVYNGNGNGAASAAAAAIATTKVAKTSGGEAFVVVRQTAMSSTPTLSLTPSSVSVSVWQQEQERRQRQLAHGGGGNEMSRSPSPSSPFSPYGGDTELMMAMCGGDIYSTYANDGSNHDAERFYVDDDDDGNGVGNDQLLMDDCVLDLLLRRHDEECELDAMLTATATAAATSLEKLQLGSVHVDETMAAQATRTWIAKLLANVEMPLGRLLDASRVPGCAPRSDAQKRLLSMLAADDVPLSRMAWYLRLLLLCCPASADQRRLRQRQQKFRRQWAKALLEFLQESAASASSESSPLVYARRLVRWHCGGRAPDAHLLLDRAEFALALLKAIDVAAVRERRLDVAAVLLDTLRVVVAALDSEPADALWRVRVALRALDKRLVRLLAAKAKTTAGGGASERLAAYALERWRAAQRTLGAAAALDGAPPMLLSPLLLPIVDERRLTSLNSAVRAAIACSAPPDFAALASQLFSPCSGAGDDRAPRAADCAAAVALLCRWVVDTRVLPADDERWTLLRATIAASVLLSARSALSAFERPVRLALGAFAATSALAVPGIRCRRVALLLAELARRSLYSDADLMRYMISRGLRDVGLLQLLDAMPESDGAQRQRGYMLRGVEQQRATFGDDDDDDDTLASLLERAARPPSNRRVALLLASRGRALYLSSLNAATARDAQRAAFMLLWTLHDRLNEPIGFVKFALDALLNNDAFLARGAALLALRCHASYARAANLTLPSGGGGEQVGDGDSGWQRRLVEHLALGRGTLPHFVRTVIVEPALPADDVVRAARTLLLSGGDGGDPMFDGGALLMTLDAGTLLLLMRTVGADVADELARAPRVRSALLSDSASLLDALVNGRCSARLASAVLAMPARPPAVIARELTPANVDASAIDAYLLLLGDGQVGGVDERRAAAFVHATLASLPSSPRVAALVPHLFVRIGVERHAIECCRELFLADRRAAIGRQPLGEALAAGLKLPAAAPRPRDSDFVAIVASCLSLRRSSRARADFAKALVDALRSYCSEWQAVRAWDAQSVALTCPPPAALQRCLALQLCLLEPLIATGDEIRSMRRSLAIILLNLLSLPLVHARIAAPHTDAPHVEPPTSTSASAVNIGECGDANPADLFGLILASLCRLLDDLVRASISAQEMSVFGHTSSASAPASSSSSAAAASRKQLQGVVEAEFAKLLTTASDVLGATHSAPVRQRITTALPFLQQPPSGGGTLTDDSWSFEASLADAEPALIIDAFATAQMPRRRTTYAFFCKPSFVDGSDDDDDDDDDDGRMAASGSQSSPSKEKKINEPKSKRKRNK
jgi:hypothetical protein